MKNKKIFLSFIILISISTAYVNTQDSGNITLPPPQTHSGMPLMEALSLRKSDRLFSSKELSVKIISNLLWAACGINRKDTGKRTAPTAVNWQEIDVYLATSKGLYLYNSLNHSLEIVLKDDIRAKTGEQPFVGAAPLNLIYVADLSRIKGPFAGDKDFYAATDTGFISQNVYLFCASEGLSTVVRGWINKDQLRKTMMLRPQQKIILAQTVGFPGD